MDSFNDEFDGEFWKDDKPEANERSNIFVVEASSGKKTFLVPRVIWTGILKIARKNGWLGNFDECGCDIEGCRCRTLLGENLRGFTNACEKTLLDNAPYLEEQWVKGFGNLQHIDEEQEMCWSLAIDAEKKEYLKKFIEFCQSGEVVVFGCDEGWMNLPTE